MALKVLSKVTFVFDLVFTLNVLAQRISPTILGRSLLYPTD